MCNGHVFRNVSEPSGIRQFDKDLWGDQLLLVISVHQLQQRLVASGEDLYVRRIRITSETYARTVFGRGDFDVGSLSMSSTRKRTNSLRRMPVEYRAMRMTRACRVPAASIKRVTSSGLNTRGVR